MACKPFGYLLGLLKKVKADVTMEHIKSFADLMAIKGRPHYTVVGSYCVSDLTHAGIEYLDLEWEKPIYGGPARGGNGVVLGHTNFHVPFKNKKCEKGIVIPISLPKQAMKRFDLELEKMLRGDNKYSKRIVSTS